MVAYPKIDDSWKDENPEVYDPQFIGCITPRTPGNRMEEAWIGLEVYSEDECLRNCRSLASPTAEITFDHAYYSPHRNIVVGVQACTIPLQLMKLVRTGKGKWRIARRIQLMPITSQPLNYQSCLDHLPKVLNNQSNPETWASTPSTCLEFCHADTSISNITIQTVTYRLLFEETSQHW